MENTKGKPTYDELIEALKLANNLIYGSTKSYGLIQLLDGYYTGVFDEGLIPFDEIIERINTNKEGA